MVCTTGLLTAYTVARLLGLDAGFAAGLLSGALTESPAIGTATEAINNLLLPEPERARLVAHIAVAHAVCYLFGAVGVIWFCATLGPRLLAIDLKTESLKLEQELGIARSKSGVVSAWRPFDLRAFRLREGAPIIGLTLREAAARLPQHRLYVERLRRSGDIVEPHDDIRLQAGDVVAVSGRREVLVEVIGPLAEEVEDRALLDIPVTAAEVLVARRTVIGKTLAELAGDDLARSIYARSLIRGGQQIPIAPGTTLEQGDILRIVGPDAAIARAANGIGSIVEPAEKADFVVLGFAIFLGGVVGVAVQLPIGDLRISLGTGVGTLFAGLLVGHMRTRMPLFGRIPDGAVSLMIALGLSAFVAMTGLQAGPIFFAAIAEAGVGLFFGGMVVTMTPMFVGLWFGHYVLRMNPILLLGGLAGAQTFTAGMAAVQEKAGSPVAVLGYTPAVPIGHVLLTTGSTVMVGLIAQ